MIAVAFAGHRIEPAADGFQFDAAQLKDKTLWTQVNATPYHVSTWLDGLCRAPDTADYESERKKTGNPHIAPQIIVYVNNAGREAMFAKNIERFPEGSVVVKEKFGSFVQGSKPVLYTIMRKREPGYNRDVGDWEFSVVSANGTEVQATGKLENCQSCHIQKRDTDFIFRPYLNPE
ncbi:MAG TPA: cytochrome P460 family protein [Pyrinomonadaceae bacterium]|nr:cytochrome P460 family protein [Pyrinomonadaceae bacterium]